MGSELWLLCSASGSGSPGSAKPAGGQQGLLRSGDCHVGAREAPWDPGPRVLAEVL